MKPTISVIVPVHNGGEQLRRSLFALARTQPSPDEIIVVVDGGNDDPAQLQAEFNVRVLSLKRQMGPARARNQGARQARGDLLFFVDADVEVPVDTIAKVREIFQEEPTLVAAFGSYDDSPDDPSFLSQYRNLLHHYVHQTGCEDASTFWAGCGAIRRQIFLSSGGFSESYQQPSIEDIELGYRLKRGGHAIRLCKELQVKHLKRWGWVSMVKTDFFQRALPWAQLILKKQGFVNDLNLQLSSRLSVVAIFLLLPGIFTSFVLPPVSVVFPLLMVLLLILFNRSVYYFFWKKRGVRFAMGTIFCHWLYFFYSGVAFALATLFVHSSRFSTALSRLSIMSQR